MADIPVNANDALTIVVVNSSNQVLFDYDFRADRISDLKGIFKRASGQIFNLVGGVDFSATGLGTASGGTVTLLTITNSVIGETLYIYRDTLIDRPNDYSRDVFADDINAEQDKIFLILQEQSRDLKRAAKSSIGSVGYSFADGLENGDTLMLLDGSIVAGPNAEEIQNAEGYAEAAALSADQASAAFLAAQAVANAGYQFATEASFAGASIPLVTQLVRTGGYGALGDGGGHLKKRIATPGAPEPWQKQSADGAWWELAEVKVNARMFGVSGVGDESTLLNKAILYCAQRRIRELEIPYGMSITADTISNPNGVLLVGSGKVNAGSVKYNARSDEQEPWIDGLEYLYVAHTVLSTENSLHKTLLVGDSTVFGAYIGMPGNKLPAEYLPDAILYRLGIEHGAGWHQVINAGVNGTTVADLNTALVTADATINTLVIKYMINDASFPPDGDAVETFATNLRNKLQTIRASRGVGSLSIILVTGNSANSGGATPERGNQWFEKAIPVLRRAARDFQCAFVDVYSPLRDNKNAANWMDVTDGGQQHTHPGVIMQHWIWGMVAEVLFNRDTLNRLTRPKPLALSNGWGALSGYGVPHISRAGGVCSVQGVIAGGTTTVGTIITTLPFGSWPFSDLIVPALTSAGTMCALKISSANGQVTFLTAGSATWTAINFSFRIG
jgi:Lysophospholipase L1 and related esterases